MKNLFDYRCHSLLCTKLAEEPRNILLIRLCPAEQFEVVLQRIKKLFPKAELTVLDNESSSYTPPSGTRHIYFQKSEIDAKSLKGEVADAVQLSSLLIGVINFTLPVQTPHSANVARFFKVASHPVSFVVDPLYGLFQSDAILKGEDSVFGITSFLTDEEQQYLHAIVTDANLPKGEIVEIGRCTGGSTSIMALALKKEGKKEQLHSFDPVRYDLAEEQLKTHQLEEFVHLYAIDSRAGEQLWKNRKPQEKQIRFLFIDGDHSYQETLKDIKRWVPYLAEEGLIALHDYANDTWRHDCFGVPRAVQESIFESGDFYDFSLVGTMLTARKKTY